MKLLLLTGTAIKLFNKFSESLKYFFSIVIKVSIDFIDSPIFNHPQLTLRLLDQSGIVTHKNNTCTTQNISLYHSTESSQNNLNKSQLANMSDQTFKLFSLTMSC